MNELIKNYLKQHYCRDYFNAYGETVEDGYYFMYQDEVEGLIELIVRECADIAKHQVMNISTYGDAEFVETQIQEHFGVEE